MTAIHDSKTHVQKYELYGQAFKAEAYAVYARMRQEDPVCRQYRPDGEPIWFVTRYADVEAVLLDHTRFVKDLSNALTPEELGAERPRSTPELDRLLFEHMLTADGTDHRRLRSLVTKAFTPRMVEGLQGRVQMIADDLIERIQEQQETDLIEAYVFPLPIIVIAELLGIPPDHRDRFRLWSNAFISPPYNPTYDREEFVRLMKEFTDYLRQIFVEKRQHPQDDLITGLLEAEEAGDRLNEEELFSMVLLLIVAGHETTVNLIGNGVLALLQHPGQLEKLKFDPSLMKSGIEEMLRYDSPVERATLRWTTEDVEMHGQVIPRGEIVRAVLGAANRDPAQFDDPDTFHITRPNNKHLSFGLGRHYCLGAPLARLEARIAIETLIRRMPDIQLNAPVTELRWRDNPVIRGLEKLPVAW